MSQKGRSRPLYLAGRSSWFRSAWWSRSGVTVTPLRSGRWLLMQSYASGWPAASRTTLPLSGNPVQVRSLLDEEVKKMLQNKPPKHASEGGVPVAVDEDFMGLYPSLWSHLTQTTWDDGTPRLTSAVTLFMQAGRFTACVVEKNWDLILFATADKLEGIWEAVDARLSDPKADWRANRRGPGDKAKRVQRPT